MLLPRLSEQQPPLITYQLEDDERVYEAIADAFGSIGFDVYNQETTIEDWVRKCPFDLDTSESMGPCRVSIIIWDYATVITCDEIRIYEDV